MVEPKLETENEVDGSAASENEEWSDADLTGPTTPHQTQAGVTAAAVAAAAAAAQSFASTTPYRKVDNTLVVTANIFIFYI